MSLNLSTFHYTGYVLKNSMWKFGGFAIDFQKN